VRIFLIPPVKANQGARMLNIKFWGVRGSIPVPGDQTTAIGGNTSCIELMNSKRELLIIDAGTGIRNLGNHILNHYLKEGISSCSVLLTHTHWDHIQGFPFFTPIYIKNFKINVYGPARRNETLKDIISGQMNYPYYPINISDLKAHIAFHDLSENFFNLGAYRITPKVLNHPVKTYGYRIECEGKVFTTVYDHETYRNLVLEDMPMIMNELKLNPRNMLEASAQVTAYNQSVMQFVSGSDMVVYDSHFTEKEYLNGKQGWGHGPIEFLIRENPDIKNLVLFHYAPEKSDDEVYSMKNYLEIFKETVNCGFKIILSKEGLGLGL